MLTKYYDQHTHSSFSKDSQEELENYFKKASEEGIEYVCTCEHFDYHTVVDGTSWEADFDSLIKYHEKMKEKYPNITPLLGIECGYKLTSIKPINEKLAKYPFDIVQLSIHDNDLFDYYFKEAFSSDIDRELICYFTQMIGGLHRMKDFDVLSHIDYGFKTVKQMDHSLEISRYEIYLKEIMSLVIKLDKALEINTKVLEGISEIDHDYHHLDYILELYKSLGGHKLTLSSDSHKVSRYRISFDVAMKIIKNHGFSELSYFIKRKEYKYVLS